MADSLTEDEVAVSKILPKLSTLVEPKFQIIKHINKIFPHSDDPKFFYFGAIIMPVSDDPEEENLSNSVSGYSFFSEEEALVKCLGEALERHCLRTINKTKFTRASYQDLASQKIDAVDPRTIVSVSYKQKKKNKYKLFNFNGKSPFNWVIGYDLLRKKNVLIPAQLIYLSYKLDRGEKCIYLPITTGAAGGSTILSAVVRGIYEIIERDAFIIHYLNKLPGRRIIFKALKDEDITRIHEYIKSYKLELHCIDITTELNIPTILSIVVNRTGIGPSLSLGLKSSINYKTAILGSIQESLHSRGWIRGIYERNPGRVKKIMPKHISTLEERALLWYGKNNIEKLDFFLNAETSNIKLGTKTYQFKEQLELIMGRLNGNKMNVYYSELTLPIIKKSGYFVVKVVIPELQPFWLFEDFPYLGGVRLYKLPKKLGFETEKKKEEELNPFPHPFL